MTGDCLIRERFSTSICLFMIPTPEFPTAESIQSGVAVLKEGLDFSGVLRQSLREPDS